MKIIFLLFLIIAAGGSGLCQTTITLSQLNVEPLLSAEAKGPVANKISFSVSHPKLLKRIEVLYTDNVSPDSYQGKVYQVVEREGTSYILIGEMAVPFNGTQIELLLNVPADVSYGRIAVRGFDSTGRMTNELISDRY